VAEADTIVRLFSAPRAPIILTPISTRSRNTGRKFSALSIGKKGPPLVLFAGVLYEKLPSQRGGKNRNRQQT
jgi:hypothetical protein